MALNKGLKKVNKVSKVVKPGKRLVYNSQNSLEKHKDSAFKELLLDSIYKRQWVS